MNPITKALACNVVGMGAMARVNDIVSHVAKITTDWDKLEVEKYSDGNTSRTLPTKNRKSSVKEEAVRKEQRTYLQYFWSEGYWQLIFWLTFLNIMVKSLLDSRTHDHN